MRFLIVPGRVLLLALGCLVVGLAGCGSGASISGTVTLDNQPVEMGAISFLPMDGKEGARGGASIENGKYTVPAEKALPPGKYKVEIRWPKKTGKKIPNEDMPMDETKEAIPPQYNSKSTLTVELTSGQNEKNFDLKSK